eukprot:TRINITY_DN1130_c0_g1_i4.p1 TRINITY_DN1130_c0_g1~~TRINITY_DN1130_c0_g1_i4.p1  ORF type:complete len:325 (-),score=61.51 TRINITY_DN1130_c0_g1_i4:55-1029(-)
MDPSRRSGRSSPAPHGAAAKRGAATPAVAAAGNRGANNTVPFKIHLPPVPRRPWSIEHLPEFKNVDIDALLLRSPPTKRAKKGTQLALGAAPTSSSTAAAASSAAPVRRGAGKGIPVRNIVPPADVFSSDDSMNATSDADNSFDLASPTRQLRASTEKLRKGNSATSPAALSSIVSLPQETPLSIFVVGDGDLARYDPKPIESPDEFQQAYKQYAYLYNIYSNILGQLEKNKEDFSKLERAIKSATTAQQREIVSTRVKNLFALRQSQVEQMRSNYQRLHQYLDELRNFIVDYLNQTLPGSWNNAAATAQSRTTRSAAAAHHHS